jgi:hypothetical protein
MESEQEQEQLPALIKRGVLFSCGKNKLFIGFY